MNPSFAECLAYTALALAPELETFYEDYQRCSPEPGPLLDRSFLKIQAERFGLSQRQLARVLAALDEIEADPILGPFSQFLVADMCGARHRCDLDDYRAMTPAGMQNGDLYSFLLLLACVQPSMERLERAGVPAEYYREIPFIPMAKQFAKLEQTGDGSVEDFPWDMNFYTCSIFYLDRFYFIPFRMEDDIRVYRRWRDGATMALYTGTTPIRRDGQLDGVNGIFDESAYPAEFEECVDTIQGYPISPAGLVERRKIRLAREEWELALEKGDILLGTHIPGGPGYEPARLRSSLAMAAEFYDRYFPEIPIKGFGSESWLYDPHLRLLLPEDSHIIQMQNQMYIYPIMSGDDMLYRELFLGNAHPGEDDCHSSLQRRALERIRSGGEFTASGMFILRQDIGRVGGMPYGSSAQREEALRRMISYDEGGN